MRFRQNGFVVIAVVVGVIVTGLIWFVQSQRRSFSPDEARQRIREGKYDVIVDVRTPEEWQKGHRADAISVPIGVFVTEFPKRVPDREARVLIICRKGVRAEAAALMARKKGYTHVHYVEGEHDGLME
jgi:rhodanese-related sulfurtransferase